MKYQSPNPYSLKVGQKVKVKVTRSKVIVSNEKSDNEVSLCQIKVGQKVEVKVTRSQVMISKERSHQKKPACEISKPYS